MSVSSSTSSAEYAQPNFPDEISSQSFLSRTGAQGPSIFWFAATTLLGAFLVFQVQPVISKSVLPWFGGTPAVWTTCMLFFQLLLFGGYLYAHLLRFFLRPAMQAAVHLSLLCCAALVLPIEPSDAWKPGGSESPTWYLLWMLAAHVGLPYFVLSSTGPLMQAWFCYHDDSDRVYRLYALSNGGSLLALLSYPFLVEPMLSVSDQSTAWSLMFCGFVLVQGMVAVGLFRVKEISTSRKTEQTEESNNQSPSWRVRACWIGLPAFASTMLLIVTNHVCQDVAVVPFLWVLPLSLYLLSFIICFDSPQWYRPKLTALLTMGSLGVIQTKTWLPGHFLLVVEATSFLALLMCVCLLCHGEVARLKPRSRYLTQYYCMLSGGGALGGLIVAVLCPILFDSFVELPIALAIVATMAFLVFFACRGWKEADYDWEAVCRLRYCAILLAVAPLLGRIAIGNDDMIASHRNFFGVLQVLLDEQGTHLVHGSTIHGMQRHGDVAYEPTTYYGRESGVGLAFAALQERKPSLHIGLVGLGCGVLTTYGRSADEFDIIEINPTVVEMAQTHFSFMKHSPSTLRHHLGDGRLVLERMVDAKFDVLILDAFSSDAIPAHLLTREAVALFQSRLVEDGLLAVHVSNKHLDLVPLVHRLSQDASLASRVVRSRDRKESSLLNSSWMLISRPGHWMWDLSSMDEAQMANNDEISRAPLWTDQNHNLLSVLQILGK